MKRETPDKYVLTLYISDLLATVLSLLAIASSAFSRMVIISMRPFMGKFRAWLYWI